MVFEAMRYAKMKRMNFASNCNRIQRKEQNRVTERFEKKVGNNNNKNTHTHTWYGM